MQVIPAIDLMNGKVVRLTRGDPKQKKSYDYLGTPLEFARKWKAEGAERLHIIDLDAALNRGDNRQAILDVVKYADLPIQLGGGIRTLELADMLLSAGIQYVIIGSLALKDAASLMELQKKFSAQRIIVALDNMDGIIMVEGWKTATNITLMDAMEKFTKLGTKTFLITSITRDGTLSGPDLDTLRKAAKYPNVEVIAAGGIGSLNDLVALKRVGCEGAVVGKALYEAKFTLKEAIKKVEEI